MKINKLFKSFVLLLAAAILAGLLPVSASAAESSALKAESLKNEVANYYKQNKQNLESWWELGALKGAGQDLNEGGWTLPEWKSSDLRENAQPAAYAAYILGFLTRGNNPGTVWEGRDLVRDLAAKQQSDGSFGVANSHVWAMIALDAADGKYNEDSAVKWLLLQQKTDGGFAFSGDSGDPDMTGMALIAMSNHKDRDDVKQAIEKAVSFLKNSQAEEGGFISWGIENSNSTAAVVSGLTAVGEDVLSEKWQKNGRTILDALVRFQLEDKSFSYSLEPKTSDSIATCQVLIALGDICAGDSIWKRLKAPQQPEENKKVHIRVEGIKSNILDTYIAVLAAGEQQTALDILKKALETNKIEYEIDTAAYGAYIKSIKGEQAGTFGGYDGWLYLVNGSMASVGVGEYKVQDGDELVFYYGMFPPDTLVPQVDIQPEQPVTGEDVTVTVSSSYYDWSSDKMTDVKVKGAVVSFNGSIFYTDEEGRAVLKSVSVPGTYDIKVSMDSRESWPGLVRTGNIKLTYDKGFEYTDAGMISDWAKSSVQKAGKYKLMIGTDRVGNTFEPKRNISRAEFTAVIVKLLGEQPIESAKGVFADVSREKWYYGYVMKAFEMGFAQGVSRDEFAPDSLVTRQEMASMIARALKLQEGDKGAEIKDMNAVSSWAKASVAAVFNRGIMIGSEGNFDPRGAATREMAASVAVRAYEMQLRK